MPATIQSSDQKQPLDNTMGAMLIGILLSAVLYGVSLVQTYHYFDGYRKDPWYLKSLVAITMFFDTLHLAFVMHTIYHYLITEYYNTEALTVMVWSVLAETIPTGVTGLLVQCFYIYRVWRLSKRNNFLAGLILVSVLANAGCSTAWVIISLRRTTFAQLLSLTWLAIIINALSTTADVLIAVSLCVLLRRLRTALKQSDTTVNKLILFVVNTGLATSICAVGSLIALVVSPRTLIYATFHFCIGRLYTNSLLAALNGRKKLKTTSSQDADHMLVSLTSSQGNVTGNGLAKANISIRIDTTQEYSDRKQTSGVDISQKNSTQPVGYVVR